MTRVDDADWSVVRDTGRWGYVSVFNDTDSQDWARPGVGRDRPQRHPAG